MWVKMVGGVNIFPQQNHFTKAFLTLSLPMITQEAFVDSVDQDQTAQNMISDLHDLHFHSRL